MIWPITIKGLGDKSSAESSLSDSSRSHESRDSREVDESYEVRFAMGQVWFNQFSDSSHLSDSHSNDWVRISDSQLDKFQRAVL